MYISRTAAPELVSSDQGVYDKNSTCHQCAVVITISIQLVRHSDDQELIYVMSQEVFESDRKVD